MPSFSVEKLDVGTARIVAPLIRGERWFLLRTDSHHDSKYFAEGLSKQHLDTIKEKDGIIIDNGDLFDAMQRRDDPRRSEGDTHEAELGQSNPLGKMVRRVGLDLLPYRDCWAILGHGNHETTFAKFTGIDLTQELAKELKTPIAVGYETYIEIVLVHGKKRFPIKLYRHHGSGGSSPVTKGVIGTARRSYVDADIIFTGHIHQGWVMPEVRDDFRGGKRYRRLIWHVQGPGYKDPRRFKDGGFEIEKGFQPAPIGAHFVRFSIGDGGRIATEISCSFQ